MHICWFGGHGVADTALGMRLARREGSFSGIRLTASR